MKSLQDRSRWLSMLLRHKPAAAGLTLSREGWCSLEELFKKTDFTLDEIQEIVLTDAKQRYSLTASHIRANQGHSVSTVKISFKKAVPPVILYHGTTAIALPMIMKQGLLPMSRHHVHLSHTIETALVVASRRKGAVILQVNSKMMLAEGFSFFLSDNGVWLIDAVPSRFLSIHQKNLI